MIPTGLSTMLRIRWQVQRRGLLLWVLGLGLAMVATAASIVDLYDTPEKIKSYADAVGVGDALVAINGRVEGINSLGGVIQDEFGFLAAFLMPLLGINLVARATRGEEASGRLEVLLGGRIARSAPPLAALVTALAAIGATMLLFAVGLIGFGVPALRSVLYALSLGALAFVFAGLAALTGQLVVHARTVYAVSLIVLAVAYVLRGVGDVTRTWLTWLSPLGWAEKAAPFGDMRWWTLLIPLIVGAVLAALALRIAAGRDLGSALVGSGPGPARAAAWLRSEIGLAWWIHRPAVIGWLAGSVLLGGMMGSMAGEIRDALFGNPEVADLMAANFPAGEEIQGWVNAFVVLYLAVVASGYVVAAVGTLRSEEAEGRLEPRLSGTLSRTTWLSGHGMVIGAGLVLNVVLGSLVFGVTAALALGDTSLIATILRAGLAYLPAELVLLALAMAVFAVRPRWFGLAWAGYAVVAFIAFLGPALRLPGWLLDVSPTTHVGNPPLGPVPGAALVWLLAVSTALLVAAFLGFRRRGIPQG